MGYPFSINKNVSIHCDSLNCNADEIIGIFESELKKFDGMEIGVSENKIELKKCVEFSSRGLRIKDLNKGSIVIEQNNGIVNIKGKVMLIEHTILFAGFGIFLAFAAVRCDVSEMPILAKLAIILWMAISIFCYLLPLISFYSFFNEAVKRITSSGDLRKGI